MIVLVAIAFRLSVGERGIQAAREQADKGLVGSVRSCSCLQCTQIGKVPGLGQRTGSGIAKFLSSARARTGKRTSSD